MNEWYRAATELYSSSLRALEQRSMSFLIVQSLLVASYAALFSRYGENSDIPRLIFVGIALLGIAFCILLYLAGRTTSQDTWLWRKRMQSLEKGSAVKLWDGFREDGKIFCLQRHCIERLPAPTLWIISPALFLATWVCAIGVPYGLHWGWYIGIVIVIAGLTIFVYMKYTRMERGEE